MPDKGRPHTPAPRRAVGGGGSLGKPRDRHHHCGLSVGPCQDISNAGRREGIKGARSGIWFDIAEAIRVLRPRHVYLENVGAIRNRGQSAVLTSLHEIGYDAAWTALRASDIGAPHHRDRWFCVATPSVPDGQ
ncbi:DNA cytosine methyltransferase [Streptomyces sp. ISL-12]|uniref:DNA cytosine methyltransferase n=1 Tax=Streptomyces sp. ISL-12 TaxID=2819177 RepID=UPI0020362D75|nr:DNA cytosine methyltransferase [Streptomyces sp. ISL-12]